MPKANPKIQVIYGVYTKPAGSYLLGESKFVPLSAVPVAPEVKDLACPESSPVEFFDTEATAAERIEQLRAQFERRPV